MGANLPQNFLRLADQQTDVIVLSTGFTVEGLPYYAYVQMQPRHYISYIKARNAGISFSLNEFGIILEKGYGLNPPDEVKTHMENQYGYNKDKAEALEKFAESVLTEYLNTIKQT